MSNETDLNETNETNIDWLENSITKEYLNYYEYSDFNNIQPIGNGSYGRVVRVNWRNIDRLFALKTFNDDKLTLKEVINEVYIRKKKMIFVFISINLTSKLTTFPFFYR